MARAPRAVVIAVFVGVAASLLPTPARAPATRARTSDAAIDANAVVLPEVVAATRRTTVRDLAQLLERMAASSLPLLLLLLVAFAGLALCAAALRSRSHRRGDRTRAPPSLLRVA